MTFEEFEKEIETYEKLNISKMADMLGVTRQTLHLWKAENKIPTRYLTKVKNIISIVSHNINIFKIEFEIDYKRENLILNRHTLIWIRENEIKLDMVYVDNNLTTKKFEPWEYKITEYESTKKVEIAHIWRYETDIDYRYKTIKYCLYCTTTANGNFRPLLKRNIANILSLFENKLREKWYEDNSLNKNMVDFKNIVNLVKFGECDFVLDLPKEQFYEIYNKYSRKNQGDSKIEPMGFYIQLPFDRFTDICEVIKISETRYDNMPYKYINCIFICGEIIRDNMKKLLEDREIICKMSMMTKGIEVSNELNYYDLYNLVLAHEIGHLIFSYQMTDDEFLEEKRANYMVSHLFDNKYDLFNKHLTTQQPPAYRDILLKPETKIMYRVIEDIPSGTLNLHDYEDYYREIERLYEAR